MDSLDLGSESLVVHRKGRRLHDHDLGRWLGPSQPFFDQGSRAFGFELVGQPEVGRGGTGQKALNQCECDHYQNTLYSDSYPWSSRTDTREGFSQMQTLI